MLLCRTVLICLVPVLAMAESQQQEASGKFRIEGSTLFYDGEAARDPKNTEIESEDVDELLALLRVNDGITELWLNSVGGGVWAGQEMARLVMDFELDTRVTGECSSSCVTVFLAGARRTLERGGKLGFHQRSWSAEAMRTYYDSWRQDEGWETPFDFASWVYEDTQSEIHKEMTYMISRGVDPAFAIETKRMRSTIWFPSRAELLAAGVLHE
ncbi:hypothetical protein [Maliponia aquimaris]|uniref:Clp protease n=1 Tax=Maliponia aquimaris TaxID=1673631 RepID=A0A238KDF2_9RHOB|nr:hypothetical protein [Maliponia aquimaris]SMX40878.1 hypothetical protein MAA8898_02283 [Maliponia aquimaris]